MYQGLIFSNITHRSVGFKLHFPAKIIKTIRLDRKKIYIFKTYKQYIPTKIVTCPKTETHQITSKVDLQIGLSGNKAYSENSAQSL